MRLRRTAAVLGGLSGMLHLLMVIHGPLLLSLVMAVAAVSCLPCAGHLWRHGTFKAWLVVGIMNSLMVLLHVGIIWGGGLGRDGAATGIHVQAHEAHHHDLISLTLPVHELFLFATVIALLEVFLCAVGLLRLRPQQASNSSLEPSAEESVLCRREWTGTNAVEKSSAPT